uniref:Putative secreted peptide n=1 Tax=Rhipicephalus pulchellus TaxID=72859 RepID=L7MA72_RHIPC
MNTYTHVLLLILYVITCFNKAPAIPKIMVHVPEEKCDHLLASVNYTKKVASTCNAKCPGRAPEYQPLRNGTACALKESWGWYKQVTEVGECQSGNCVKEGMENSFARMPKNHAFWNRSQPSMSENELAYGCILTLIA